jgi:hypothetical protein
VHLQCPCERSAPGSEGTVPCVDEFPRSAGCYVSIDLMWMPVPYRNWGSRGGAGTRFAFETSQLTVLINRRRANAIVPGLQYPHMRACDTNIVVRLGQRGLAVESKFQIVEIFLLLPGLASPVPNADDLLIYPAKGQSAEQQDQDRYGWHRWTFGQSGFEPSNARSGTSQPQQYRSTPTDSAARAEGRCTKRDRWNNGRGDGR